jgi:hypothetical protein
VRIMSIEAGTEHVSLKEAVRAFLAELPDNATFDDIMDAIYARQTASRAADALVLVRTMAACPRWRYS